MTNATVLAPASIRENTRSENTEATILKYLPLVKSIASRMKGSLPPHVDLEDLVQAGTFGLIDAANKFDQSKKVDFPAYAKHRIRGSILDSLRNLDGASRDMRRLHNRVEEATRILTDRLQRTPTESEIADEAGIDVQRLRDVVLYIRGVNHSSCTVDKDADMPAPEPVCSEDMRPDNLMAHEQSRRVLGAAMQKLSPRDQHILVLYYDRDTKMKEIGQILGINESRVSQLRKRAVLQMTMELQSLGITSRRAI